MHKLLISVLCLCFSLSSYSQVREIALTIDDLPLVGTAGHNEKKLQRKHDRFMQILQYLVDNKVPATGFVIANSIETGQWELLEAFRNAGLGLGNHTYSHRNLDNLSAEQYIQDVAKADRILTPIMTQPKFFRYPYLAEGNGEKKKAVQDFLYSLNYRIAPVTIDSKDYYFNEQLYHIPYHSRPAQLPNLIKRYVSYVWQQTLKAEQRAIATNGADAPIKQILLIHSNLLNSHALGELIEMYKANGYKFIPLTDVLPNDAAVQRVSLLQPVQVLS